MTSFELAGLQDILRFRDPAVRDLAWTLRSPPLLSPRQKDVQWPGPAWSQRAYLSYEERLRELDRDASPLHRFLATRRDHRLGNYFESLLNFWLCDPANTLYRLVANGIPVRQGQQTLGELDFIVRDAASGQFQHWEVAVKFYLGVKAAPDYAGWIGPGLRDRLDLKLSRLLDHQLPLVRQSTTQALLKELGVDGCTNVCLLKGRLFYPLHEHAAEPPAATPDHWRGWWLPVSEFLERFQARHLQWCPLPREHWLTPLTPDVRISDLYHAQDLLEQIAPRFDNRAIAVVGLNNGREEERGFITPTGWPDNNMAINA